MSNIHTTEIKLLLKLQEKDLAIDALNKKISFFPKEIDNLNEKFKEKKISMQESKSLLIQIQVEKKDRELSMAQKEEDIKKHQRELNLVKNNNAFKALLTEIERDKEGRDTFETDILILLEKLDEARVEDKKICAEFKKNEDENALKIKEIDDSKKECEVKLEALIKERAMIADEVSEDMISKYDRVRNKRGNAVIEVKEDSEKYFCSGCNMTLIAQNAVDVKKKDSLAICDNCQRMLYLKKSVFE